MCAEFACVEMLTKSSGQGQRCRRFRAPEGRESEIERRTGVNRPERALGEDSPVERAKGEQMRCVFRTSAGLYKQHLKIFFC